MNRSIATLLLSLSLSSSIFIQTDAQDAPTDQPRQSNGLRVFLDCQRMWCEMNHIRREIPYVNWMRDRQDADVHVLATSQSTGGGRQFIFNFMGLREFAGHADTLRYTTSNTDVRDEEREGQTRILQMGLMRFIANTPVADRIEISYSAPAQEDLNAQPEDDPWSFWVFRIGANGSFESESKQREYDVSGNIRATRTTEDWRFYLYGRGEYGEERYTIDEDSVSVYPENSFRFNGYAIRNLGAHWGTGVRASIRSSISYNHDLAVRAAGGVQYSVFPYSESTRKAFTFLYTLGVAAFDYEEITIFGQTSEVLLHQELEASIEVVQPWGNLNAWLNGSSYLHDLSRHRIDFGLGMSYRIVRGLDFNWHGTVSRIKDQIYLSGAGIPQDEILLRRRALGTDYRARAYFGLSYTFGSIYNNVVNPTMDDFR